MMNERLIVYLAVAVLVFIPMATFFIIKADAITLILNKDQYAPNKNVLVIIPIMTANAYKPGAFYDYYSGRCGIECLTTEISQSQKLGEAGSENTWRTLERVGYAGVNDYIIDYQLQSDPEFLQRYDTIIVLHSEYLTTRIFNALQNHHNVIYLVPNSSYALVDVSRSNMRLIQGHGYNGMDNAFGWKYDNTKLEYQKDCNHFEFNRIANGWELNCNPELTINHNFSLLSELRKL